MRQSARIYPYFYLLTIFVPMFFVIGPLSLFYLIHNFTLKNSLLALFGWILIHGLGCEVGLHRLFSHQQFTLNRVLKNLIAIVSVFACQYSPIFWATVHGAHHKSADSEGDPHSPKKNFLNGFIFWYFKMNRHMINAVPPRILLKSKLHIFLHKNYELTYLVTIILAFLVSPNFAILFLILPGFISLVMVNLVNWLSHISAKGPRGFQHLFFYRNYPLSNDSNNCCLLSLFTWGLALHNNHHNNPAKLKFSEKNFEFDLGYPLVQALKFIDTNLFEKTTKNKGQ